MPSYRSDNMKFSQFICRCGSQDLDVLGSSINEDVDLDKGDD